MSVNTENTLPPILGKSTPGPVSSDAADSSTPPLSAKTKPAMSLSQDDLLVPEGTMDIVLDSLRELVDYELAVVLSYGSDDRLTVRTAKGPLATPRLAGYSISLARRRDLARLLARGKPELLRTEEGDLDTYVEILDLPVGHSCLASPLTVRGQTVGLLTLDHRSCGVFSQQILRFVGVISRLIAVALAQSEASRHLRERNSLLLAERNRLLERDSEAFRDLAGTSQAWMETLDSIKLVAATESPVLLLGETGTGKEEAARAIHRLSTRSTGPFVALNCSAMPASLAESELFGHEKGSFTGAQALRRGRFELADGGTLFLDEIGDLPPEIQPKLLRAIQEGRFERVGGEHAVNVDVRIVAATHIDLGAAVESGRFREDLFYRIAVFPIRVPPLRERGEDAVVLAELFAARLRSRPGWENLALDAAAIEAILRRSWPGNVRELRNAIERAAILARGRTIGAAELCAGDWARGRATPCMPAVPLDEESSGQSGTSGSDRAQEGLPRGTEGSRKSSDGRNPGQPGISAVSESGASTSGEVAMQETAEADPGESGADLSLAEVRKHHIEAALRRCRGKIYGSDGAAAVLGLAPSTLQSALKRLGIRRADFLP